MPTYLNVRNFVMHAALSGAVFFAGSSTMRSVAHAEDLSSATSPLAPGTFTSSAHSDEWKIANALSAAPASITDQAAVMDWPTDLKAGMSHGKMLRHGMNGWTCMPDFPGRPQHNPMCVDETMMKWGSAALAGTKPNIDRVGMGYMLMGEAREAQGAKPPKDPRDVKEWFYVGPHLMVVLPDADKNALREMNQSLSNGLPFTSFLSSAADATPILIMPIGTGGNRLKEEPIR